MWVSAALQRVSTAAKAVLEAEVAVKDFELPYLEQGAAVKLAVKECDLPYLVQVAAEVAAKEFELPHLVPEPGLAAVSDLVEGDAEVLIFTGHWPRKGLGGLAKHSLLVESTAEVCMEPGLGKVAAEELVAAQQLEFVDKATFNAVARRGAKALARCQFYKDKIQGLLVTIEPSELDVTLDFSKEVAMSKSKSMRRSLSCRTL